MLLGDVVARMYRRPFYVEKLLRAENSRYAKRSTVVLLDIVEFGQKKSVVFMMFIHYGRQERVQE